MNMVVCHMGLVVHHMLNMFHMSLVLANKSCVPFKLRSQCAFVQIVKVCMKLDQYELEVQYSVVSVSV